MAKIIVYCYTISKRMDIMDSLDFVNLSSKQSSYEKNLIPLNWNSPKSYPPSSWLFRIVLSNVWLLDVFSQ